MRDHIPGVRTPENPKIAVFVSFSGDGGVERMVVNLMEGLLGLGCRVDLLPIKTRSIYFGSVPADVRIIQLGSSHSLTSLMALVRYLRLERPTALLAAKNRANQVAIIARSIAGVSTPVMVCMHTTLSRALADKTFIQRWSWYILMRLLYPRANAIVGVSEGVASDMANITGLPSSRIHTIPNPVITQRLHTLANEPLVHPWFGTHKLPVILGVGRLTKQKDFSTLLKAFAKVQAIRPSRLVILGEGKDRSSLEALASKLGVKDDMALPGFVANPYPFIRQASLFVLSSIWEGSPTVLTEALALGTPVVSTDCPSGPREILANGRFGPLVPMGNPDTMAHAILTTLDAPLEKYFLKTAARTYTVEESSRRYLETLLGTSEKRGHGRGAG